MGAVMTFIRLKMATAVILTTAMIPGMAQAETVYPPFGGPAPAYISRSDYYRTHPREDPEPFRCTYAADSTCPGRYYTGFNGDPRDDPEPFRCTYAADADCPNGGMSGIQ